MKICRYCNTKQADTNQYCENCGAPLAEEPAVQEPVMPEFAAAENTAEPGFSTHEEPTVSQPAEPQGQQPYTDWTTQTHQPGASAEGGIWNPAEGRLPAVIAYFSVLGMIISLLMTMKKERSEFTRSHQSQALVLALASVVNGWVFSDSSLGVIIGLVVFAAAVYSLVMACSGKISRLPLIGNIRIF